MMKMITDGSDVHKYTSVMIFDCCGNMQAVDTKSKLNIERIGRNELKGDGKRTSRFHATDCITADIKTVRNIIK